MKSETAGIARSLQPADTLAGFFANVVRPLGVVAISDGVDEGLELFDFMRQFLGGVELVAPLELSAFDAPVEIESLGWQDEELEAASLTLRLERGFALAPAVDSNPACCERRLGEKLVENRFGAGGAGMAGHAVVVHLATGHSR
ncbi:hypothetical protein [Methylocystis bryophila]|uniref:hypothetical protein n=1 Tax=Methylocystis bryophila TaxID=655015 RepID=UPI00131A22BE|nr:hypothetical protein [Methylocystis bryophila]